MAKVKVIDRLLKQLADQGYVVKQKRMLVRKTFVVEEDVLTEFLKAQKASGVKLQDAATEALQDWTYKPRK